MKRMATDVRFVLCAAALLAGLAGCATFRSNYFTLTEDDATTIDRFRLTPRIFAFKEARVSYTQARAAKHFVTLRIEDPTIESNDESWRQSSEQISGLADGFLRTVTDIFVIDSLVLHETPGDGESRALLPDRSNYSPRRENYLTFRFGQIDFPATTVRLRAVLHFTRAGDPPAADSVVYQMWRVALEERGLLMFESHTQGY